VVCPADANEATRLMEQTLDWPGPIYIRLGKGGDAIVSKAEHGFQIGRAIVMRQPGDVLMVTTGIMLQRALAAADLLAARGIRAGILHMHTVKPLDTEALLSAIRGTGLVVTLEEHVPSGGLGSAVAEALIDKLGHGLPAMLRLSLPDRFMHNYGSQDSLMKKHGLAPNSIAAAIERAIGAPAASSLPLHST
jgi:transketolase